MDTTQFLMNQNLQNAAILFEENECLQNCCRTVITWKEYWSEIGSIVLTTIILTFVCLVLVIACGWVLQAFFKS